MNNIEKDKLHTNTSFQLFIIRLMYGFKRIIGKKALLISACAICILEITAYIRVVNRLSIFYGQAMLNTDFTQIVIYIFLGIVCLVFDLLLISLIATPLCTARHKRAFHRIGLLNRAQEAPALLSVSCQDNISVYEYFANGIPCTKFTDDKASIEASLNISVISIYQGKDKTRIIITAKRGTEQLPDMIQWSDEYLTTSLSEIVLGQKLDGLKIVDLDVTPHIQCGGITGSGKTILLKCVLHQLYLQESDIYLCDFKGFVDFSKIERGHYYCVGSKEALNSALDTLLIQLKLRKELFSYTECSNITEYNYKHLNQPFPRIILASDEIAYAFQKKGLPAKEKALIEEIESKMTLIAQQGRFAGIHLWLSTQRGDADTIPPQIRSNLNVRICGKASELLSRVTVDNSLASQIPNHIRGRFVDDNEEFFQAFYYKE